jgi:hypothetical protein
VIDNIAPVFSSPPADVSVQCLADVPVNVLLNYTDNCDLPGSVMGVDVSDGMTCPETITRTWAHTDACGNVGQVSQTIIVYDDILPVFTSSIPANTTVSCYGAIPATVNIDWSDNCDGAGFVPNVDLSDGNTCPETITRMWSYTDWCGNTVSAQQTIVVHDQIAPTFSAAPADITVECTQPMTQLAWTDNCDGSGMVSGTDMSNGGSCPEILTRIWVYTDGCGNVARDTQIITINDVTPPTIICPLNITVNCPNNVPAPSPNSVGWSDNCGVATVTHLSTDTVSGFSFNGMSCPALLSRKYLVTDLCGNTATCEQYITIRDRCNPQYVCPLCTPNVPFFFVDLSNNPDSMWVSTPVIRDGTCCGQTGPPPPRCVLLSLILAPEV